MGRKQSDSGSVPGTAASVAGQFGGRAGGARRLLGAAAVALIVLGALGRLIWLEDMEFKSDEREWVDTMVNLWERPYSPLAPESHHSGIPHSSGFFHFLRVISFASNDPVVMVSAIAGFSAAVMLLGLAFPRRTETDLLALAMMSTSFTLFLGTRKIWTPDLIAAWPILGLCLWSLSERAATARAVAWLTGASAFAFVIAPHMYLSAVPAALAPTLAVPAVWLLRKRARPGPGRLRAWLLGAFAGWATFIPYFVARLFVKASPRSNPPISANEFGQVVMDALTLPSPLKAYLSYLWHSSERMREHHPSVLLDLTLIFVVSAILVWTLLFWAVLARLLTRWRQTLDSPMVVAALLAWIGTAAGILSSRLGSWLNYWLGAVPFVYFLMACTAQHDPGSRFSRIMRPALWAACVVSLVATFHFALLIHRTGGFSGEYGKSYRLQMTPP
jgi:hypothetical protein